jgi:cadmium resistance protein CadD (predicted permease)
VTDLEIAVVVIVLYVMLFVIIGVCIFVLVQCPTVGKFVGENARYFVPFMLIGLGIYILYGSIIWNPELE